MVAWGLPGRVRWGRAQAVHAAARTDHLAYPPAERYARGRSPERPLPFVGAARVHAPGAAPLDRRDVPCGPARLLAAVAGLALRGLAHPAGNRAAARPSEQGPQHRPARQRGGALALAVLRPVPALH